jgi:hypothetical protein
MQKWLGFVLALVLSLTPSYAGAQGGVKLDSINIELWSEFDQPSMLVICEFVVSKETTLPTEVTLRFPKDGNLIAVAYENNGALLNAQFESPAAQGKWQTVTLSIVSYDPYRIEYYQPLTREGDERSFNFHWFGDYSVTNFNLSVVLPVDSVALNTSPAMSNIETSPDGQYLIGTNSQSNLKMGHSYQFDLTYERTSDTLSDTSQANEVQSSEPIRLDTPGRVSVDKLPWFIGGIGLALIAIALFIYWRSSEPNKPTTEPTGKKVTRRFRAGNPNDTVIYCQECGTRSISGDRFCRTCGTRLRSE